MSLNLAQEPQHRFNNCVHEIADLLNLPQLPSSTQNINDLLNHVIEAAEKYRLFLVDAILNKKIDPTNDIDLLKAFLESYSLRVPFELEKYIDEGDIIEIYSEDFVQIYRNHTFFSFCSYDIYTILSHPFHVLFRRDDSISAKIFSEAQFYLNESKEIGPINVPKHFMQEHFAKNDKVFEIQHKWCSPVISNTTNKIMGLFCTQKADYHGRSNVHGIGFVAL